MCAFFHVSRSGYYDWCKRRDREDNSDIIMRDLIAECQRKNRQCYGYRRVVMWLRREYGIVANHKSVLRIMNKYNMLAVVRRRRCYRRTLSGDLCHPNILKRNFKAERPNEKWATDITYIKTGEGVLFLSAIKDLYDNYIIGYKTSKYQDFGLVARTINAAKRDTGDINGVIIHSDQGYQYTSFAYRSLTQEYGMTISMSNPGNPLDNACAENFFSILKTECIYRETPNTLAEAEILVDEYIDYYNNERLQVRTGMTPAEWRYLANYIA